MGLGLSVGAVGIPFNWRHAFPARDHPCGCGGTAISSIWSSTADGPSPQLQGGRRERHGLGNVYPHLLHLEATLRLLEERADIVIPRDERSGSASDAGVPQFMDFVMVTYASNQARMRDGLGWINAESRSRFGVPFPDATAAQRLAIVDDIAWPAKATKAHQSGVRFFNAFRDLTASGFFTSRIGVKDIGYMGNMPLSAWTGCTPAAEQHIGVR